MKKLLIAIGFVMAASAAHASTYIPVLMSTATNPAVQAGSSSYSFHVASGTVDRFTAPSLTVGTMTATGFTVTSGTLTWVNTSTIQVNGNQIQATAGTRIYTLPDAGANASIIESTGAQTMSNKTLDNATLSTNMAAGSKVITGLGAGAAAGQSVRFEQVKILQVVNATLATSSATTSTSYIDTGLTATITPTSSSNKIFVLVNGVIRYTGTVLAQQGLYTLTRGASDLNCGGSLQVEVSGVNNDGSAAIAYLDSPATTSATTYKIQIRTASASNTMTWAVGNAATSITLIEVAP